VTTAYGVDPGLPKWALIVFGVLSIVAGILAFVWPGMTIIVLVMLLGIQLLMYGVVAVVRAFQTGQGRVLAVIFGVLAFIAGTALFLRPLRNLPALVIIMSVFWVVGGLVQSIGSIIDREEHWVLELCAGLFSIVAGIVAIAWPGITLLVIAVVAGSWLVVIGVIQLVAAFRGPGGGARPAMAV
jgi:uncharacterized membrane protein HdeD (DUF308 family)